MTIPGTTPDLAPSDPAHAAHRFALPKRRRRGAVALAASVAIMCAALSSCTTSNSNGSDPTLDPKLNSTCHRLALAEANNSVPDFQWMKTGMDAYRKAYKKCMS